MPIQVVFTVVLALAAIAATVLLCIKVLPSKFDGTFSNKLLQKTHDYFNFKTLYLEKVLKVLFTFATIFAVLFFVYNATLGNIINVIQSMAELNKIPLAWRPSGSYIWTNFFATFFTSILSAVIVPVLLRLIYEGLLMFVLLVKNVGDINNKMKNRNDDK